MSGFEEFLPAAFRKTHRPTVSIGQAAQNFGFNGAAHELMGKPSHVVLLWDKNAQVIGFRPSDGAEAHAYRMTPLKREAKKMYGALVSCRAFLRHFDIEHVAGRVYTLHAEEGIYIVRLTDTWLASSRPRRKAVAPIATT